MVIFFTNWLQADNSCVNFYKCHSSFPEEVGSIHVSFQEPLKYFTLNQYSEEGSALISV